MFPPRRVLFTLLIWLAGAATGIAQEAPSADRPAWVTLFEGTPWFWTGIVLAWVVSAALLGQLFYTVRINGVSPPALNEALAHAIGAGNYQEAWEACMRWRQTMLARMLLPALERIGQGHAVAAQHLADRSRREHRHLGMLLTGVLAAAGLAVILCLTAMIMEFYAVPSAAMTTNAPGRWPWRLETWPSWRRLP